MATTTNKSAHHYNYDYYTYTVPNGCIKGNGYSEKCPHMLPCGHCRYLGYMCPYNGIHKPTWQAPIVWC